MKIDHVAMYVNDLEAEKDFFVKYFKAQAGSRYSNFRTESTNYFLKFDDGARLEIMKRETSVDVSNKPQRTGYNHIAICVGDRKDVDDLTKRMEKDGVDFQNLRQMKKWMKEHEAELKELSDGDIDNYVYKNMNDEIDKLADIYVKADREAAAIVNSSLDAIFAYNYNDTAKRIKKKTGIQIPLMKNVT